MALSPVGNTIYVNQQVPFVSSVRGDHLARFELQNIMAQHIANEKEKEVQEVREAEENHPVDPDREHQRQELEQQLKNQEAAAKKKAKNKQDSSSGLHQLDIRV